MIHVTHEGELLRWGLNIGWAGGPRAIFHTRRANYYLRLRWSDKRVLARIERFAGGRA